MESPRRHGLLIGIDRYPCLNGKDLSGCVNDARLMHGLLTTRFGFPAEGLELLLDEAASREGILAAMDRLRARVGRTRWSSSTPATAPASPWRTGATSRRWWPLTGPRPLPQPGRAGLRGGCLRAGPQRGHLPGHPHLRLLPLRIGDAGCVGGGSTAGVARGDAQPGGHRARRASAPGSSRRPPHRRPAGRLPGQPARGRVSGSGDGRGPWRADVVPGADPGDAGGHCFLARCVPRHRPEALRPLPPPAAPPGGAARSPRFAAQDVPRC
ncbi:MAG: caspase family protein [bacterium]